MKKINLYNYRLITFGFAIFLFFEFSQRINAASFPEELSGDFSKTIIKLTDKETGIPPSHLGHPGFKYLTFLYDVSVNAMMLKMTGHQREAERIMDYFVKFLILPPKEIMDNADSNGVLGVLKMMTPDAKIVSLVNAFDLHTRQEYGHGKLEYFTTPGPVSFIIMTFLQVNRVKYLPQAIQLGKVALFMQHRDGGIYDGDRSFSKVNTEPHLDSANAFYQLYMVTGDKTWKIAGDKAIVWFRKNVYQSSSAQIYQGIGENGPNKIFATDVYSWTMAGIVGDIFSTQELEALTDTMLSKCLSQVTVELPGGIKRTMIMADFTDSRDPQVVQQRQGVHPMGSPEWSGGVILALQKNAVRFWDQGYFDKARFYKAMAEYLMSEVLKSRYKVNGMTMFFYATGQGVNVGHGWKTPYFYVKDLIHPLAGGSLIGGWPIMPLNGFNPFILDDKYFITYQKIDFNPTDHQKAVNYIASIVDKHRFIEPVVTKTVDARTQIVEPSVYNASAWKAFDSRNYKEAIFWSKKVIQDFKWVELAQKEEEVKMERFGGIIDYPWGTTYKNNESPIHNEISKYPLLNEVAATMWILANSFYELKDFDESKYWVQRIIQDVPLHQIAHVVPDPEMKNGGLIDGYWNAIISWFWDPPQSQRDKVMRQWIVEMGLESNVPHIVGLTVIKSSEPLDN